MTPGPTLAHAVEALRDEAVQGIVFLEGAPRSVPYGEVVESACARGVALLREGILPGDRVALMVDGVEDFVVTLFALARIGAVPIPMFPPMALGRIDAWMEDAGRILAVARARALIVSDRLAPLVPVAAERIPHLPRALSLGALNAAEGPAPALPDPDRFGPDDLALLQFTSGSTVAPKGVRVTQRNLAVNSRDILVGGLGIGPEDRAFSWLPLYHDMGLIGHVIAPLRHRLSTALMPTVDFLKDPSRWMKGIAATGSTITFAPNFAFALAARAPFPEGLDLTRLRVVGCGAEPMHAATLRAFIDRFAPAGLRPEAVMPCYGLAEATLAVSFDSLDEPIRVDRVSRDACELHRQARPAAPDEPALEIVSCGRVFSGLEALIVGPDGAALPERHIGEIVLRGPSIAAGYEGADAPSFAVDGLRTGDLGYLAEGRLHLTGRAKDLLILNGRNHDPQSIELHVQQVPGVRSGNAVAFTRPGRDTEELVLAFETREPDPPAVARAIREQVYRTLGLRPADVVPLPPGTLPKTSSGKLQRGRARARYIDGRLGTDGTRSLLP